MGASYKMAKHDKKKAPTETDSESKCQLAKTPNLYSGLANRWREDSEVLSATVGEPDQK